MLCSSPAASTAKLSSLLGRKAARPPEAHGDSRRPRRDPHPLHALVTRQRPDGEVALGIVELGEGTQLLIEALDAVERLADVGHTLVHELELGAELGVLLGQDAVLADLTYHHEVVDQHADQEQEEEPRRPGESAQQRRLNPELSGSRGAVRDDENRVALVRHPRGLSLPFG